MNMTTDKMFSTLQTEKAASAENGRKAPTPNKSISTKEQRDFLKLLQIFFNIDVNIIRQMFLRCSKDFVRTIDNILYVKRYCMYLSALKKRKEAKMQKKTAASNTVALQTINQNLYNAVEVPVQNKLVSVNNSSQNYQSYDSSLGSSYASSSNYVSDPFYNSQGINSTQSSLYSSGNNSAMHLSSGSMDTTNNSLNDTYGNAYFYDPFTNLTETFRSSTPDIINMINNTLNDTNI